MLQIQITNSAAVTSVGAVTRDFTDRFNKSPPVCDHILCRRLFNVEIEDGSYQLRMIRLYWQVVTSSPPSGEMAALASAILHVPKVARFACDDFG
jgi:hypothetical protein